jgi:hypothetical protein
MKIGDAVLIRTANGQAVEATIARFGKTLSGKQVCAVKNTTQFSELSWFHEDDLFTIVEK